MSLYELKSLVKLENIEKIVAESYELDKEKVFELMEDTPLYLLPQNLEFLGKDFKIIIVSLGGEINFVYVSTKKPGKLIKITPKDFNDF